MAAFCGFDFLLPGRSQTTCSEARIAKFQMPLHSSMRKVCLTCRTFGRPGRAARCLSSSCKLCWQKTADAKAESSDARQSILLGLTSRPHQGDVDTMRAFIVPQHRGIRRSCCVDLGKCATHLSVKIADSDCIGTSRLHRCTERELRLSHPRGSRAPRLANMQHMMKCLG